MTEPVVVVGGGIAGLLACGLLAKAGHQVVLLEAGDAPGGLLRSVPGPARTPVDLGTHVPRATGDTEIDGLLFDFLAPPVWADVGPLRAGHVLAGRVDHDVEFPNLAALDDRALARAQDELLDDARGPSPEQASLADALAAQFGPTVTDLVFTPMLRKFTGLPLDELSRDANRFFAPRVVAFAAATSRAHKSRSPHLDNVLAFASSEEGASPLAVPYPAAGGVGRWIDDLLHGPLERVEIRSNTEAVGIELVDDQVTAIRTSDGDTVPAAHVIWTVGIQPFRAAADLPHVAGTRPAVMRHAALTHLAFDHPVQTDRQWITVFDDAFTAFRLTFYDNLRQTDRDHTVTIEVLLDAAQEAPTPEVLADEILRLGLLPDDASVVNAIQSRIANGFPTPTPALDETARLLLDATSDIDGVTFIGRGRGTAFFMADVLRETRDLLAAAELT